MSQAKYTVGDVARIARVTVRTLHHYDQIGLLTASSRTTSGYRQYTRSDLERLQQIRFHRELGLALEEIRAILDSPDFDAGAALRRHREVLVERLEETRALVTTIDRMLQEQPQTTEPGEGQMSNQGMSSEDLFDGFRPEQHEREAEERWGNTTAWKEASRRTKSYGPEQWREIKAETDALMAEMAKIHESGATAESAAATAVAERHRRHIDRWFYPCDQAMHSALASMYVADPRFAESFDRHGEGLSDYFALAIRANGAAAGSA